MDPELAVSHIANIASGISLCTCRADDGGLCFWNDDEGDTYVDDEEGADILRAWCSHRVTGDAKRPLTDLKNHNAYSDLCRALRTRSLSGLHCFLQDKLITIKLDCTNPDQTASHQVQAIYAHYLEYLISKILIPGVVIQIYGRGLCDEGEIAWTSLGQQFQALQGCLPEMTTPEFKDIQNECLIEVAVPDPNLALEPVDVTPQITDSNAMIPENSDYDSGYDNDKFLLSDTGSMKIRLELMKNPPKLAISGTTTPRYLSQTTYTSTRSDSETQSPPEFKTPSRRKQGMREPDVVEAVERDMKVMSTTKTSLSPRIFKRMTMSQARKHSEREKAADAGDSE